MITLTSTSGSVTLRELPNVKITYNPNVTIKRSLDGSMRTVLNGQSTQTWDFSAETLSCTDKAALMTWLFANHQNNISFTLLGETRTGLLTIPEPTITRDPTRWQQHSIPFTIEVETAP